MFKNVSGKLKAVAKIYFWVNLLIMEGGGGTLLGFGIGDDEPLLTVLGIAVIALFPLSTLITSWLLYGFAEIIENTRGTTTPAPVQRRGF